MFLPETLITSLSSRYQLSTIKVYDDVIRRLYREAWNQSDWDSMRLTSHEDVMEHLEHKTPKDAKRILVIVNTILGYLDRPKYESTIQLYRQTSRELAKQVSLRTETRDADRANYLTLEEIIRIRDSLPLGRERLILTLYTRMPPLRGEEWCQAIVTYHTRDVISHDNYLHVPSWCLILNHYKTAKQYDQRRIPVPIGVRPLLEEWLKTRAEGSWLFPGMVQGLTSQGLNDLFYRIFKPRRISTSMLRKIYISEIMRYVRHHESETETSHVSDGLAQLMGHSVSTQEFTYNRLKDFQTSSDVCLAEVYQDLREMLADENPTGALRRGSDFETMKAR